MSSNPHRFAVLGTLASNEVEVLERARDTFLDREVVLKHPGPELVRAFRKRDVLTAMLKEARALARVKHPAVASVLDVIVSRKGPVLVLEPYSGETLAQRLDREGALPPDEVLRIGREVADALEAATR